MYWFNIYLGEIFCKSLLNELRQEHKAALFSTLAYFNKQKTKKIKNTPDSFIYPHFIAMLCLTTTSD